MSALTVDRLPDPGAPLQVVQISGGAFGADGRGARAPHRHAYHELFWTRGGTGEHTIDGEPIPVRPGTVTLIGRDRVHVFERAHDLDAAVVRFGDELLHDGPGAPASPAWLLGGRGPRIVEVPPADAGRLDAVIAALADESRRPPDARSAHLERHLLAVVLLWIERWYDAARTQQRGEDDADTQLHRRFAQVLERDFARHHDAVHYADALGVPAPALARALTRATGRGTKEHVTDRVILEAARLLRFTDLTVGEVAFQAGFADPLYFSRVQAPVRRVAGGLPRQGAGALTGSPYIRAAMPWEGRRPCAKVGAWPLPRTPPPPFRPPRPPPRCPRRCASAPRT